MSAEDTGLREAVERLVRAPRANREWATPWPAGFEDGWDAAMAAVMDLLAEHPKPPEVAVEIKRERGLPATCRVRVDAEHQPTTREARCVHCGHVGPEDEDHSCPCPHSDEDCPDHQGCDCTELCEMGPTCPGGGLAGLPGAGCWRTQPAPVAPAGEVGLSEEEREALEQVVGNMSILDRTVAAVERILATRLAAAEQRVTEAKAEALREAADALRRASVQRGEPCANADACCGGAESCDAVRPIRRMADEKWLRDRAADLRAATTEGGEQRG